MQMPLFRFWLINIRVNQKQIISVRQITPPRSTKIFAFEQNAPAKEVINTQAFDERATHPHPLPTIKKNKRLHADYIYLEQIYPKMAI